jgi:hypothetical protein
VDVAFGVEIGASGTFIAKTSMGWSNMAAKLDLTNAEKSTLALVEKTPASQVSLDFEARLVATPSITAGLLFGSFFAPKFWLFMQTATHRSNHIER